MIGRSISHYRILGELGSGGMGVVYLAEDERLGRQVAIKFLPVDMAGNAKALERFRVEARAASSLSHPGICAIHDIGDDNGKPFIVMELLKGETLRDRLDRGPLKVMEVLDVGIQLADALEAAHAQGIVHRDIKPANIFLTEKTRVKILDFGLAKLVPTGSSPGVDTTEVQPRSQHRPPENQITIPGTALGTVCYMSPEQARGEEIDARSDLFSLGVVLYEMATGQQAFGGSTTAVAFEAILNRSPTPVAHLNPAMPERLESVILTAIEKDPALRYQHAADLQADLRRVRRDLDSGSLRVGSRSVVSSTSTTMPSLPAAASVALPAGASAAVQPVPIYRRRIGILATLAAIAILAAAGWTAWRLVGDSGPSIDSVAVLPFTATGAATDTEYLTDGLTEALINGLAQLTDLRVAARSVVFRYKGKDVDPQQVGRELKVRTIVTGQVSTRNNRLVIRTELMNIADGTQLWGGQYDRATSDLLVVQDEIANEILDKIRPRLSTDVKKRVTKRYTDDSEAYQLYLQGRYNWNKGTIAGYKTAIEYFQQAIQKDQKYALAYAGLADSYLDLGSYWVEAITEAKTAAMEALSIDPNLAEAHVSLGHIKLWLDWDWPAAQNEFARGIELNPASALAHDQYAMYLAAVGKLPEAIAEVKRAQELDPLSAIINADLGWCLLYSGQNDDAITQFRKTIELDSNSVSAHRGLGIALSESGQGEEGITELKRALLLSENSPVIMGHLGAAYARQRNLTEADRVLKELQSMSAREYVPSSALAIVYAALGDRPHALDWLEKAYDEHDFAMAQLGVAPWFATLRADDRFQKLIGRLGLQR